MYSAWYEVLSVLHLMAMLSLSQANLLLLPRTSADGYQPKVSEGVYYLAIHVFYVFFAVNLILILVNRVIVIT